MCYSLHVYMDLSKRKDLTKQLSPSDISSGMKVDISPYLSSIASIFNVGCCAATGMVVSDTQEWDVPINFSVPMAVAQGSTPGHFLVEINSIQAPSLKIKEIKI